MENTLNKIFGKGVPFAQYRDLNGEKKRFYVSLAQNLAAQSSVQ